MALIKKSSVNSGAEFHPLHRALHEMFIYLKARPDLDSDIMDKLDELISISEDPERANSFAELEKKVREFLFKLEFYDQGNEKGREEILRRISKSIIELYIQDDEAHPYQEELIRLGEQLALSKATSELEAVRVKVLDAIMKTNIWQNDYSEKFNRAIVDLSVKLLGTLKATTSEYEDFNIRIDELILNLKEGCSLERLKNTTQSLETILQDYSAISDNHQKERQELLSVIRMLIDIIAELDSGNSKFVSGLDVFVDQIQESKNLAGIDQIRERLLLATQAMRDQAKDAGNQMKELNLRILKSQSRVLTLEEELQKMQTQLADALKERDLDALTELPNRRAFEQELSSAADNFSRHKSPHCIAMLDIDYFKEVNDTYGHQIGDKIL